MLSSACKYAIRAILFLAIHSNESNKIGVKKISEYLETPQPFLAKLLQQLSNHKLLLSTKGPKGGFYLTELELSKSLWKIIISIDGADKFQQCFLGLSKCNDKQPCPAHHMVKEFRTKLLVDFKEKTIKQLADEIKISGTLLTLKQLDL
ncbi:Rrf2 family transcriptional regulator [Flavobacteriaceae bacterium]|nr:Rrf2 family transcriptional regulator [Flavobacteriaceae bacterium]